MFYYYDLFAVLSCAVLCCMFVCFVLLYILFCILCFCMFLFYICWFVIGVLLCFGIVCMFVFVPLYDLCYILDVVFICPVHHKCSSNGHHVFTTKIMNAQTA